LSDALFLHCLAIMLFSDLLQATLFGLAQRTKGDFCSCAHASLLGGWTFPDEESIPSLLF
jgi:hypothetical protein